MKASVAIVTERGGETCHAAIVARELGVPCVVGCKDLDRLTEGALVTVDGSAGKVYLGEIAPTTIVSPLLERVSTMLSTEASR